jgi:uncharacterized repeat protein (TIGR03803 family)
MLMICWDGLRASRGCIMRLQFSLLSFALALTGLALGQAVGGTHERLPNYHVLHAFGSGKDGGGLWGSVVLDKRGDVFGTTEAGGAYNAGTVFQLTPQPDGAWRETIIHNFSSSGDDGASPYAGLLLDRSGDLYGTTVFGGSYGYPGGTVFQLARRAHGWVETVLHSFDGPSDFYTCCPVGNLVRDEAGALYGATPIAFQLSPGPCGWTETALHNFGGENGDGYDPRAGPIRDAAGNLYGTTAMGGGGPLCTDGCGTVWELMPSAADDASGRKAWKERILHRFGFSDNDGVGPSLGQLAMDAEGNLYGAADGGKYRAGIVFKLTRVAGASGETWRESILYSFGGAADGNHPGGGVILDGAGNLYGTTIAGGSPNCGCGVVFKLSPQTGGTWKYTLLHTFVGTDGAQPDANLTLGPDGKLYGTTATGGAHGGGVVFQLIK